jgi:GH25 family lysozyme M1 (1,4-beta-N-acetylmuramidase)
MLNFLDTSNWQGGYSPALTGADAVIVKATEGTGFVDPYCDSIIQQAMATSMPWGFYHFAGDGDEVAEAVHFINNCSNYFGSGIPVLDWEGNQSVDWVNRFVETVHDHTGVWPWIYANPWRFNQGGVNPNCARWVASYPDVASPTWSQAQGWDCPDADGNVVAWQFCSDGTVNGIAGNVDLDLFYGTKEQWQAYARGGTKHVDDIGTDSPGVDTPEVLENASYKVTIERK